MGNVTTVLAMEDAVSRSFRSGILLSLFCSHFQRLYQNLSFSWGFYHAWVWWFPYIHKSLQTQRSYAPLDQNLVELWLAAKSWACQHLGDPAAFHLAIYCLQ